MPSHSCNRSRPIQAAIPRVVHPSILLPLPCRRFPPFHVISGDILVNVCWFASLVLSLGTASFAILVKQWLQEYIDIGKSTPQQCLRIRHDRHQGVENWGLYRIAAILPFFLQIALALFFVGLCSFTSLVHSSIANTTFCIVGGWAALFLFTLVASMSFPQCPYRIAFLPTLSRDLPFYTSTLAVKFTAFYRRVQSASSNIPPRDTPPPETQPSPSLRIRISALISTLFCRKRMKDETSTQEGDLAIFYAIDCIHLNDSLLNDIRVILKRKQKSFDGSTVLRFVDSLIQNRYDALKNSETPTSSQSNDALASPQNLSRTARTSLAEILSDSLLHEMGGTSMNDWYSNPESYTALDASLILLIKLILVDVDTPKVATSLFQKIICGSSEGYYKGCALLTDRISIEFGDKTAKGSGLAQIISIMVDALNTFDSLEAANILRNITHWSFFPDDDTVEDNSLTYRRLLDLVDNNRAPTMPLDLLSIVELSATVVYRGIRARSKQATAHLPLLLHEQLRFILKMVPILQKRLPHHDFMVTRSPGVSALHKFIKSLFSDPSILPLVLGFIASNPDVTSTRRREDSIIQLIQSSILSGKCL